MFFITHLIQYALTQMHLGLVTQLNCKLAFYVINLYVFVIDVQW